MDEKKKAINLLTTTSSFSTSPRKPFILLSKYYKDIGLNKERTSDLLLDWLKKQKCNIDFSSVIYDLEKAVNNVYQKDYIYIRDINVGFYQSEIDAVNKLKSKGEKKTALTLLYLSKIFGSQFYCYHLTVHRLTSLSIRHIQRIIPKLEEQKFITVVYRNQTKKIIKDEDGFAKKRYNYPNTYRIDILNEGDIVFTCGDISHIDEVYKLIK